MNSNKFPYFKNNREIDGYNNQIYGKFRAEHEADIVELPLEKIHLVEPIHIRGHEEYLDGAYQRCVDNSVAITRPLIVCKDETENGLYSLVIGWKDYMLARKLEQETVRVIVVDMDRKKFKKSLKCVPPYMIVPMDNLNIPADWEIHEPKPEKLQKIHTYQLKHHQPMKPIVVDKDMTLKDGYAQYIYNKNMEIELCQVMIG